VQESIKGKDALMKILRLLFLLLVCFVVIGLFRGWFKFSGSDDNPGSDKVNLSVSVDKTKMKEDVGKADKKIGEKIKKLTEKSKSEEKK
jgi:hypothetical protein